MPHKCKIALSILKGNLNNFAFGFVNNETITCDINDNESVAVTAIKLAQKYIEADIDWLDIKKVGFYSSEIHPVGVDAKTGKSIGEKEDYTYLLFRVRISGSVQTSEEIGWISSSDYDDLVKLPLLQLHLDSILI